MWDVDGNEYVEYGSGLRSMILGHAHPAVNEAVIRALADGVNFVRPGIAELETAEAFLDAVPTMEMVKFAKNGSDVTTAAAKLARAVTGRDLIAVCSDHPFFSTDDWFIGTTPMHAGIPETIARLTTAFPYGDLAAVEAMFDAHDRRVAALFLEVETAHTPAPEGYLAALVELAHSRGALVVFDEMITGFRWALQGAHGLAGVTPDLATFGKGIGNGFSVSALAGRRDLMQLGGLDAGPELDRVFLLSTTHGSESTGLAALRATIDAHRREGVAEQLMERGARLRAAVEEVVAAAGLSAQVTVSGRDCNLVFGTRDADGAPSQGFRTLFMRELIRHGVLAPSFVVSAALTDDDIERTAAAVAAAMPAYAAALDSGDPSPWWGGPSIQPVFRRRA